MDEFKTHTTNDRGNRNIFNSKEFSFCIYIRLKDINDLAPLKNICIILGFIIKNLNADLDLENNFDFEPEKPRLLKEISPSFSQNIKYYNYFFENISITHMGFTESNRNNLITNYNDVSYFVNLFKYNHNKNENCKNEIIAMLKKVKNLNEDEEIEYEEYEYNRNFIIDKMNLQELSNCEENDSYLNELKLLTFYDGENYYNKGYSFYKIFDQIDPIYSNEILQLNNIVSKNIKNIHNKVYNLLYTHNMPFNIFKDFFLIHSQIIIKFI